MKGGMKVGGMTTEEVRDAVKDRLFIGKKVKVIRRVFAGNKKAAVEKETGAVIGMYPYIFTVDFGRHKESFRYSQFYENGTEVVRL